MHKWGHLILVTVISLHLALCTYVQYACNHDIIKKLVVYSTRWCYIFDIHNVMLLTIINKNYLHHQKGHQNWMMLIPVQTMLPTLPSMLWLILCAGWPGCKYAVVSMACVSCGMPPGFFVVHHLYFHIPVKSRIRYLNWNNCVIPCSSLYNNLNIAFSLSQVQ